MHGGYYKGVHDRPPKPAAKTKSIETEVVFWGEGGGGCLGDLGLTVGTSELS